MHAKGWVKTTFEKEFIDGDTALYEVIKPFGHDVKINHKPEWDYLVYGDLDAYNARNTIAVKVNPDDRYKRQTA